MKKKKMNWAAPLLFTAIFLALDIAVSRRAAERSAILGLKIFAFFGALLFYNLFWVFRSKRRKMEYALAFPFFVVFLVTLFPLIFVKYIVVPMILLTLGSEFIILSALFSLQEKEKVKNCTVRTAATVIDNKKERLTQKHTGRLPVYTYCPVLSFFVNGEERVCTYGNGFAQPVRVGRILDIFYNPENPEEFRLADENADSSARIAPTLFTVLGVVLCLAGIAAAAFVFLFH